MALKHSVMQVCGSLIPEVYRPPAGVLFPYGHIVSDNSPEHIRHLFRVPGIAKFKSDIDLLCRNGRPLEISQLDDLPRLREDTAKRTFMLSFDDGMREVHDTISPILREKGIPAIFFINSATIDNRQLMWRNKVSLLIERSKHQPGRIPPQITLRQGESLQAKLSALRSTEEQKIVEIAAFFGLDFNDYLQRHQPYLTRAQVLELAHAGFEIGAHSDTHPFFNQVPVERQKEEIFRSVSFVRSLGLPCRYFAFPFNDEGVPLSVFDYMKELGILLCFGTSEARLDSVGYSFQRFSLDGENSIASIPDILKQLSLKSVARRLSRTEQIIRN